MKKVLIVIGKLSIGGAEKIAYFIGRYADKERFQIHYIVYDVDIGDYEDELINEGCYIHHLPNPSDSYTTFLKSLCELMKKERFDVVHSHTMFNSGWIILTARIFGVPIRITHSHSIKGFQKRSIKKNAYEKLMRKVIQSSSTHCVACGRMAGEWLFGKKHFNKYGNIILNGIDISKFQFNVNDRIKVREMLGLQESFVIGHIGHLLDVKHQDYLITLMPEIIEKIPNAKLLLLGEGKERNNYQELANGLNIADRVIMPGNVYNVEKYLSAMDLFCFPSRYEGTPLTLLEAQANGLPCVVSDQVPPDVFLTSLIKIVEIDNNKKWLESIFLSRRDFTSEFDDKQKLNQADYKNMLHLIFQMYEGNEEGY